MNSICGNCLQDGAKAIPHGVRKGDQRDSWQESLYLCPSCSSALARADYFTFHERFTPERVIRNLRKA